VLMVIACITDRIHTQNDHSINLHALNRKPSLQKTKCSSYKCSILINCWMSAAGRALFFHSFDEVPPRVCNAMYSSEHTAVIRSLMNFCTVVLLHFDSVMSLICTYIHTQGRCASLLTDQLTNVFIIC